MSESMAMVNGGRMPGPELAQQAAREAKRLNLASRGFSLLIFGGFFLVSGALFACWPADLTDFGMGLWCLSLGLVSLLVPGWIQRARAQTGFKLVSRNEPDFTRSWNPSVGMNYAVAMLLGLLMSVAGLIFFWCGSEISKSAMDYAVASVLAALFLLCAKQFIDLRCWESLALSAAMLAAAVTYLVFEKSALGVTLLCLGLGGVVAGASLHARWQRFVASLPKEDAN